MSDPVDGTVSARRSVWFEVACGAAALIALAFLLVGAAQAHDWPSLGAVVLFSLLLVAAENAAVLAPSTVGVSPAFMVVMASIAAYGHHGVALGAAITGLGGGIALRSIVQRKFRIVAFNCFQYSIAAVAAASVYQAVHLRGTVVVIIPVALAALSFFVMNAGLVLVFIVRKNGRRAAEVWADMWPDAPNYLVFGLLGLVAGQLYASSGPLALLLLVVPLAIARWTFSSFLELRHAEDATIAVFLRAIAAKDPYTAEHTQRVTQYSAYIAEELGYSYRQVERLRRAALMHDIGKLAVPKHLLNKPGKLTEEEFRSVQRHCHVCVDIMGQVDFLRPMTAAAAGHHSRYDGGGYGGTGEVSREAFVVAVADAFDAMTSTRAYRKALSQDVAFAELRAKSGTQFDPGCVEALISALERRGEVHGPGHEETQVRFEVEPPARGVGSAGLGDIIFADAQ